MKNIKPIEITNDNLVATQIEVKTGNNTDVSIDLHWTVYDANGGYVDDGIVSAVDDDLKSVLADDENGYDIVCREKNWVLNFQEG